MMIKYTTLQRSQVKKKKKIQEKHSCKSYVRQVNKSILNLFNRGQVLEHNTMQNSAATME